MAAISKVEDGVVELRTDVGRLYVRPTSWQRIYLYWTFRNFHTLPQQVLNPRQRHLIDKLWRTALVTPTESVYPGAIIGVVENIRVLGLPSTAEVTEAAKKEKPAVPNVKLAAVRASAEPPVAEISAEPPVAETSAAQAGVAVPAEPANPPAHLQSELTAITAGDADENCVAVAAQAPHRPPVSRNLWRALAPLSVAAVLLVGFELLPLWRAPQLEIAKFAAPQVPPAVRANMEARTAKATGAAAAADILRPPAGPKVPPAAEGAASSGLKMREPAEASSASAAAANSPLLPQIVEAPQSGFIYPVAPNPNLVGKVVLKAVVGSDGAVKQVEVLSGDRALAAAAARAVRHWRYAPAEVQGRAVEGETHVTVSFLGDDAVSIILPQNQ